MIDANYYLNLRQDELLEFMNLTEILPIDDKMLYNGHVYQLTFYDMQALNLTRNSHGYPNEYSGPEKNKGDANRINMMDLTKIKSFVRSIEYETENNLVQSRNVLKWQKAGKFKPPCFKFKQLNILNFYLQD